MVIPRATNFLLTPLRQKLQHVYRNTKEWIFKMTTQNLKLNVKSGEKDGKNFWDQCGVLFVHTNDAGDITSITVKHSMFPDVEMVAFPKKENNDDSETI
jgi:hypothetical protein